MMTLAALRALLARIPAMAYVVALCCALLLVAGWSLYRTGYSHGEVDVHRNALEDSVTHAVAQIDTAVQETERTRKVAQMVKRWGDSSRVKRQTLRDSVESMLSELPEPVVSLIRQDDQQIRRDSVTITAYVAVDSAWAHERYARSELDTVLTHQADVGHPAPRTHHLVMFIAGAVAGAALLLVAGAR